MMQPLARFLKSRFLKHGAGDYTIWFGEFRGQRMKLDLQSNLQFVAGLYEREVYPFLCRLTSRIQSAIDVGAADGLYTIYSLRKTPAKVVIAVEPLRTERELLLHNAAINALSRDRLQIVSDTIGQSTTIDKLAHDLPEPIFVKLDIEGAELDALMGSTELLKRDSRWLIETHSLRLEQSCADLLRSHGYEVRIIPNARWRRLLPEGRSIPHNRWLAARPSEASVKAHVEIYSSRLRWEDL
ncbi:MAG: hypothetical protein DMG15_10545 [Acidobacteria bacterium]|nr:MAG: hypothetical protein DMG15_10545 [Acidobacteriota bacterium]